MSTMDSGSACSRCHIYGQMVYLGSYTMDSYYGLFLHWHYIQLWTIITSGDEAYITPSDDDDTTCYSTWWWYLLHVITMMLINGTFTCYIPVMSTTQFLHPMSPSSMSVYTKDNASLQSTYLIMLVLLVKLFSSYDTHVLCHVMSCFVL